MINVELIRTYGWDVAVQGMRNPMNSWEKSDSKWIVDSECGIWEDNYDVGEKDLELMKQLVLAGTDHSKFLRQIGIGMNITAPLYWWKEFDTYKVGTVANSCSTMHKIAEKEFILDDFSCDHLHTTQDMTSDEINVRKSPFRVMTDVIDCLNAYRELYIETKDKKYWWQMIQLLPSSYNQKRTITMNYAVARSMYHARKHHKLDEWVIFCDVLKLSLPRSELITMEAKK